MNNKELKLRNENKYYINQEGYYIIRNKLKHSLKPDCYANNEAEYMVRSLYFDDLNNSAFYNKQSGIYYRKKYRIRIYNGKKENIRLEKKVKFGDKIAKISERIPFSTYETLLTKNNLDTLLTDGSNLLREWYIEIRTKQLKPKVMVDYDREVYVAKTGNVRITFDKNLRTTYTWNPNLFDFNTPVTYVLNQDRMIMEIKYDGYLPTYIKNMLHHTERDMSSISKYVLCRQKQQVMRGTNNL